MLALLVTLVRYVKSTMDRGKASAFRQARPRALEPHEVLGVRADASAAEISAAYRKLAAQYHPDKVATSAPEIQELAARRLREINDAYARLSKG